MKSSTKRWAMGGIVAALAGYLLGILTAPKSGKETRKDIQNATLKAKAAAERKLKSLHSELNDLISQGTAKAKQLQNKAKEEMVAAVGKAQIAKEKVRTVLSAMHEGGADDTDLDKAVNEASKAVSHLKSYLKKSS